ncbi:hypothetical protein E6W94_15715 [Salmonella enterica subsp. enterica serovar Poano]|nr:hypothetical protein [Salmonella enterica subsp. enterica serovar Poano]
MKKLIIAAGIAAATMASFGASATTTYDTDHASWASLNTTVTGNAALIVTASNDKTITVDDFKQPNQNLGAFTITVPASETGIAISDIHSHGYPSGFKVKFNACEVVASSGGLFAKADKFGSYDCEFSGLTGGVNEVITLETSDNMAIGDVIKAGVKTITAKFVSFHD